MRSSAPGSLDRLKGTAVRKLRPCQSAALAWSAGKSRLPLFMEMRLGKSLVLIRWSQERGHRRFLCVAPAIAHIAWQAELEAEGLPCHLPRTRRAFDLLAEYGLPEGWTVVTYERVRSSPWLLDLEIDGLGLDESVAIKSPKAQITKLLVHGRAVQAIGDRAILTGLPQPEKAIDYFEQLRFLFPSFMGCRNYFQFRERFYELRGFDWVPKPSTEWRMRKEIGRLAFTMTREAAGYVNPKEYLIRGAETPGKIKRAHDDALGLLQAEIAGRGEVWTNYPMTGSLWASRLAGGFDADGNLVDDFKLRALIELLETEVRARPAVIWARFDAELRHIALYLQRYKLGAAAIVSGASSPRERAKVAKDFEAGVLRYVVCQGALGKYSLKLTRADDAIYYSNHWDLNTRVQSEDRILAVEKQQTLNYYDLCAEDTVDVDVRAALLAKRDDAEFFNDHLAKLIARRMAA